MDVTSHPPARWPSDAACGVALGVAAAVFAALLAAVVAGGTLVELDHRVAAWFARHAEPPLTAAMLVVTNLNSTVAVGVYAALIGLYEAWRRNWRRVALLVACVGGGLALNDFVKHLVQRARPVFDAPHLTLQTYSFPSGHAAGSMLLYGLLLVGWIRWIAKPGARTAAAIALVALVGIVGLSRIYLGVHYLSDVLAGYAEGAAWLALCVMVANHVRPESVPA